MARMDKECDDVKQLETEELKHVYGGEIHIGIILGIGSIVSFVIGVIDGFVHPKVCK